MQYDVRPEVVARVARVVNDGLDKAGRERLRRERWRVDSEAWTVRDGHVTYFGEQVGRCMRLLLEDPGYCYLRVLLPRAMPSAVEALGAYPGLREFSDNVLGEQFDFSAVERTKVQLIRSERTGAYAYHFVSLDSQCSRPTSHELGRFYEFWDNRLHWPNHAVGYSCPADTCRGDSHDVEYGMLLRRHFGDAIDTWDWRAFYERFTGSGVSFVDLQVRTNYLAEMIRVACGGVKDLSFIFDRNVLRVSTGLRLSAVFDFLEDVLLDVEKLDNWRFAVDTTTLRLYTGESSQGVGFRQFVKQLLAPSYVKRNWVLGSLPHAFDLFELWHRDFSQCACMVHRPPRYIDQGCATVPVGSAPPIRAAALGYGHTCVVSDAVRRADERALQLVISEVSPASFLDGKLPGFAVQLCTSSTRAKIAHFGRGYCYLRIFRHDSWWRMARILGPNPMVISVLWCFMWFGASAARVCYARGFGLGCYHFEQDDALKYPVGFAGRVHYALLRELLDFSRAARVI